MIGCQLELFSSSSIASSKNNNHSTSPNQKQKNKRGGGKAVVVVGTISFSKNGEWIGKAFDIQQGAEKDMSLFPTVSFKNAECQLNFGATTKFRYPPPKGYMPLAKLSANNNNNDNNHLAINPRDVLSPKQQPQKQKGEDDGGSMVIVIEPTRDLAQQTYRAFDDLSHKLKEYNNDDCYSITAALLVGGIPSHDTVNLLKQNKCDILVGTPLFWHRT